MSPSRTYFDIMGLPRRYQLDPAELEARYRDLSQKWHPDRHGKAPPSERAAILMRATDLNEAYRVLKSEGRRAEYLLKLHGIDVGAETPDKKVPVDPDLLMEILEVREALQDARLRHDDRQVQALAQDVRGRSDKVKAQVARDFALLEAGETGVLGRIASALVAQRYYHRFHEEIEAYEEAREESLGTVLTK